MSAPLRALLRFEIRLLIRSRFTWIVLVALTAAMAWGGHNGQRQREAQQAVLHKVALHEADTIAINRADLARYRRPGTALPYWQDPGDVAGYMRYGLVAYATKPPSPLAALSIGQSRLLPFYLRTELDHATPQASAFDFASPRELALGEFDLSFVLVYLLPLALIALGATRLAEERDAGVLLLMAAQATSFRDIAWCKCLAMLLVCVPAVLAGFVLALLIAGVPLGDSASLAVLAPVALALAGTTILWIVLAALVAAGAGVAASCLRLVSLWMAFTFVVPAAIALAIGTLHPAPGAASLQYLNQVRSASNLAPARRDQIFLDYLAGAPAYTAAAQHLDQIPYATKSIAVQRALELQMAPYAHAVARQTRLASDSADLLRWLSPAMVFDHLLEQAAGTGARRHQAFLARAHDYTETLRAWFWPRALAQAARPEHGCQDCLTRLNFDAHAAIPRFTPDQPLAQDNGAIAAGAFYLWALALASLLLLRRTGTFRL